MRLPFWITVLAIIAAFTCGILVEHKLAPKPKINTEADYYKNPKFKPDTVHDTIDRAIPYPTYVPPKIVYLPGKDYKVPIGDTVFKYITLNDNTIQLPDSTIYKGYDRLIYGEIKKDTLRLDLQSGNNPPYSRVYLTDYSRNDYQIINNSIRTKEKLTPSYDMQPKLESRIKYTGTYLNFSHEFTKPQNNIGTTMGLNIYNIRVVGFGSIPLSKNPQFTYGVRVGYKLF